MNGLSAADPAALDAVVEEGLARHRAGRFEDAEGVYRRVLAVDPSHADALHLLGVIAHQRGDQATALDLIGRAIAVNSSVAIYHNNLGEALLAAGKAAESAAAYRRAIELKSDYGEAHNNLANAVRELGKPDQAIALYRRALEMVPDYAEAHSNMGNALMDLGRLDEAVAGYRRAIALKPGFASAHSNLSSALKEAGRLDDALAAVDRAIAIRPGYAEAHRNRGNILRNLNRTDDARAAYRHSNELKPDPGLDVKLATLLPIIPASEAEIAESRRALEAGIDALAAQGLKLDDPYKQVGATNFFLAYHGLNDRDIQIKIARFYLGACPALAWTAPHCAAGARREPGGKIKVGFISRLFYDHSVGHVTAGIIAKLPRETFSVTVLFVPRTWDDVSEAIAADADATVTLPVDLEAARQAVAEQQLDILVYTDIGMDPFTYFLAFARLAPVQCVMPGHPVTTGIPAIDYFLSCDPIEPDDADAYYSETLVRLGGQPIYYLRPDPPTSAKSRAELGLPESGALYVCPMMLFKIHPSFDAAMAAILRRDPEGHIVLFKDRNSPAIHEAVVARFAGTMPDVASRVCFLPFAKREDFLSILIQCDVALDNFGFAGCTTTLQTLAIGTPIVTWPTLTSRSRGTYSFYRTMGLMDCVVTSLDEYVDVALRLGSDRPFRDDIKAQILDRNHVLYEDPTLIEAMSRFLANLVSGRDGGGI